MGKPGQVVIRLLGDQKGLSRTLGKAEGRLGKFGRVGGAALAGLAVGAVAAGAALAAIGGELADASNKIRVGTGKTGADLEALEADFKAVVSSVPANFADASTAVADLNTRLGLTGQPLQDLSEQALNLSRITGTDVAGNVSSLTRVLGDWSIATEDQGDALDKVFRASQSTGIGIQDLATNVVNFGSPLRQLGFGFEEALALFGRFEKEGVNTETVMSGLRMGLKNFAQAGEDPAKALPATIEAIKNAGTAAEANAIAFEVFGARAGADMAAAVREGRFDLEEFVDVIENGDDTINAAAEDTLTWRDHWQKFSNILKTKVEPIATRVFETITVWAERAVEMIDVVAGIISNPNVDAGGWVGFVSMLVVGFSTLRDRVVTIFNRVREIIAQAREWWQQNSSQIESSTAGMRDFLQTTWDKVWTIISAAMEAIAVVISTVLKIVQGFWDRFGTHIIRFVTETWENVKQFIAGALDFIHGVLEVFIGIFTGDWNRAWEGIKKAVAGIWNAIQGIIRQVLNTIRTILGAAVAAISQIWSWAWNSIKTFFNATVGQLISKANELRLRLIAKIRELIEGVLDFFRNLPGRVLDAVGDMGSTLFQIGRDLIGGFLRGIRDMASSLVTTIRESITDRIPDFIKDRLGISSPSKLMMELGAETGKGLAIGLENQQRRVGRAAASLASVAEVPLDMGTQVQRPMGAVARRPSGTITKDDLVTSMEELLSKQGEQQGMPDPEEWGRRAAQAYASETRLLMRAG